MHAEITQQYLHDYFYRSIEDEFTAGIFAASTAEDRIDELHNRKVKDFKMAMSVYRIISENMPCAIL